MIRKVPIRKVPKRNGTGVSNSDRHERADALAVSAAKYMQPRDDQANGPEPEQRPEPPAETASIPAPVEPLAEPQPASKAARKPRTPPKPKKAAEVVDPEGQGGEKPAFHLRAVMSESVRIDEMAAEAGVSPAYIKKALQKGVMERLRELRDTNGWGRHTKEAAARLEQDTRGDGPAFGRSTMNLSAQQVREVYKGIHDPLRIHSSGQVMTAFARVVLAEELEKLEKRLST